LFETAYDDLCRIARGLRGAAGIPDPAALVHEAYLRFRERPFATDDACRHGIRDFVFVMARAMKTVARDRRRRESARKRGGATEVVALEDIELGGEAWSDVCRRTDVRALREAMQRLAEDSPERFAALVHHDFAGRTLRETARRMGIPEASVRSYRRSALRWLRNALGSPETC